MGGIFVCVCVRVGGGGRKGMLAWMVGWLFLA